MRAAPILFLLYVAFGTLACTEISCEADCQYAYDDCTAYATPGASRLDCGERYDQCMSSCVYGE